MKMLLVGGNFDNKKGSPSSLINKIISEIKSNQEIKLTSYNGGTITELHNKILNSVKKYDVVMWFANVPNDEIKERDVKALNPKTILITSKRNDNNKYTFAELITHALSIKANLTIEFSKTENGIFNMMIFDPLGTVYYNGTEITPMVLALLERTEKLCKFTRVPTFKVETNDEIIVPNESDFFDFAHNCADIFHNLIRPAKNTERFLGNMSFRCQNGFPSFRGDNNIIYVSRRNVDKSNIDATSFVPTYLDEKLNTMYYGNNKPSVDTPVQLRLYSAFPWVKYMIHAHCYIDIPNDFEDCVSYTTFNPIPCGAIEEVKEILDVSYYSKKNSEKYVPRLIAVNLIGHGCILMATDVDILKKLQEYKDSCFVSRPMPETPIDFFKNDIMKNHFHNTKTEKFDEYFSNCKLSLKEFTNLLDNSKEFSSERIYYEEFGSSTISSQSMLCSKNNKTFDITMSYILALLYKKAFLFHPERAFIHCDDDNYHIILIMRDISKMDVYINMTSSPTSSGGFQDEQC